MESTSIKMCFFIKRPAQIITFAKNIFMGFWNKSASVILRNRYIVLIGILALTVYLGSFATNMRLSYTEANMLPEDHEANIAYNKFLEIFGEEGNLVLLGVKDSTLFQPEKLKAWNGLAEQFKNYPEVQDYYIDK